MTFRQLIFALAFTLGAHSSCQADLITFSVTVLQDSVPVGGTVDWQLFVTVSEPSADNFGIDTASANLMDSFGDTLSPGTVGAPGDPFAGYSDKRGGTFDSNTNKLLEIGAVLLTQSSVAEADFTAGDNLGPLLLASGSFTVQSLGTHTLSAEAGSANMYFTAAGDATGTGVAFMTAFNNDTFQATPEPGTAMMGLVATALSSLGIWVRRRRSAVRA